MGTLEASPREPSPNRPTLVAWLASAEGLAERLLGWGLGGCGGILSLLSPSCLPGGPQGSP